MLDVNGLLNKLILMAKDDRASKPYSADESFIPKIILVGPNDEISVGPGQWRDEDEKYALMRAAAEVARQTYAQAIALVSDTRWLKSDVFCDYFKIDPPRSTQADDVAAFQKSYYAVLRQYGGQIKNLPRQLWNEAVMVAIKGPRCGTHSILAPYTQGPGDRVLYLPPDKGPMGEKTEKWKENMNLIPAWWQ